MEGKETYSQRHCLNISWTTVSHPLFERFMRSLSGTRPFNMRYSTGNSVLTVTCPVVDRSQLKSCLVLSDLVSGRTDINGYIPISYRMPNAREPDKPHTNAQVTFIHLVELLMSQKNASVATFC